MYFYPTGFTNFAIVPVLSPNVARGFIIILFHHVAHLHHGVVGVPALLSD